VYDQLFSWTIFFDSEKKYPKLRVSKVMFVLERKTLWECIHVESDFFAIYPD
jgi:hypothetical protein